MEMYGPPFLSAYGEKPSPLWMAAISDLSDEECRVGLTTLARQAREYPANLTQFVGACRPPKQVRFLGTPTTPEQLRKQLPAQKAPREVAERWLAEMRKTVGA